MQAHSSNKLLGGVLLIAGTAIGAGMLALPVVTGLGGFIPTLFLFSAYWLFMTYQAFLVLEVTLWMKEGANFVSMAKYTLGKVGEAVTWFFYLFLLYLLTTAYLAGGGPILVDCIEAITGYDLPQWIGAFPLLVIFGFLVYKGTELADYFNRVLIVGLVVTFFMMLLPLFGHVQSSLLMYRNWEFSLLAVSVIATSFGYHIIIPTLSAYMHHNVKQLSIAIFIGGTIPLLAYIAWEIVTLGIIPLEGQYGIYEGYEKGLSGVHQLVAHLKTPAIAVAARAFSFFAIVTSFLGVTLSLSDFLADGLKIKKNTRGRMLLFVLTFAPALLFILSYPRPFLLALDLAGAFGVIVLQGFLPPLMVWYGRYVKQVQSSFRTPGGKSMLLLMMVLSSMVTIMEVMNKTGLTQVVIQYFGGGNG